MSTKQNFEAQHSIARFTCTRLRWPFTCVKFPGIFCTTKLDEKGERYREDVACMQVRSSCDDRMHKYCAMPMLSWCC